MAALLAAADGLGDAEPDAGLEDAVAGWDERAVAIADAPDGADAVPPTLAHDDSSTVAAAIEASERLTRPR